jgi:hypothetical protein
MQNAKELHLHPLHRVYTETLCILNCEFLHYSAAVIFQPPRLMEVSVFRGRRPTSPSPTAAAGAGALRRCRGIDEAAEDHLARGRLQHARYDDVDRLADHLACIVHDDHRAVVEVGDALVVLLAFLEDEHLHHLAGQHHGLQRVGELVDVQHFDAAQLRDLVQIEVVGDDLPLQRARELDQLQIDLADVREVHVGDRHVDAGHLLDLLQDVQTATAAIALHRVGGVGNELKLLQHELRHDQRAVHESRFADVGDAAVDDHARVEHLCIACAAPTIETAQSGSTARATRPCVRR